MMKAVFDLSTNQLTVIGNDIQTLIFTVTEMGEWNTVNDLEGNPLFDIQLDHDDYASDGGSLTNPINYSIQYVNLIKGFSDVVEQGEDWRNAELTVITSQPYLQVLGISNEYKFDRNTAKFLVEDKDGKELIFCTSLNMASDIFTSNNGSKMTAIDENGLKKVIAEPTYRFNGDEYVIADKFEDGGLVVAKKGLMITKLNGTMGRENWLPLKLKSVK